jgi:SAM-dependent methyltransferase
MGDPRAEAFDEWARQGAGARMEEAHGFAGRKVLDRLSIGYDESFIDLGCGNGWATRYVAEKVPTIGLCVGVDGSPELIKEARGLFAGKFPVKFLVAPMEDVPFGEGSFNHAFSMEAIYYTEDPARALRSIWRVLKPGGTFHLVIDFYAENPPSKAWQRDFPAKMHFLGEAEWVSLLGEAGFADVRAERVLDDRPVPSDLAFPWGGFKTREDLARFRTSVGSLYIVGRKLELSHALDPYLDRARQGLAGQEAAGEGPRGERPGGGKSKKRRGLF